MAGEDETAKGIWFKIRLPPDQQAYFDACGRIRGLSHTALLRRVLEAITESHLVASILDDDGKPAERKRHEHRPRRYPAMPRAL